MIDFYFEGIAMNRSLRNLLFVTSDFARSVTIAVVVFTLADFPFAQCLLTVLIEISYLSYLLKSKIVVKKLDLYFETYI